MITYILAILGFLSLVRGIRLVLIKRKAYEQSPDPRAKTIYKKKGRIGVLLIHGYTSSPLDFKPMIDFLSRKNITVLAPLLKGHGTSPQNLATTSYVDWEKSVKDAFNILKKNCSSLFVVGHSFGGNLCIELVKKNKVKGFISIATPVFFQKQGFVRAMFYSLRFFKVFFKKKYPSDYNNTINKARFVYNSAPVNTMSSVIKIIRKSIRDLDKVKCPVLVLQSRGDKTTNPKSADFIYNKIGCNKKELKIINDSHHLFILDKKVNKGVFKDIYYFIKENLNSRKM